MSLSSLVGLYENDRRNAWNVWAVLIGTEEQLDGIRTSIQLKMKSLKYIYKD